VAQDHAEEPDLPRDTGLIGELHRELGEIHLGLLAGRRFEPALELELSDPF
jgi:hypothetical protein